MKKILTIIIVGVILTLVACGQKEIEASSLVVDHDEILINVGTTLKIKVSVLPSDTTDPALIFQIEDETIASVSQEGVLEGKTLGDTTLIIKVKNAQHVEKRVPVSVVDGAWPTEKIKENYGLRLPAFPSYSSIVVHEEANQVLVITLAGYGDDERALNEFFELLLNAGYVSGLTNNHHIGSYTIEGFDGTIGYHNNTSHGKDTIDIIITPKLDVETSDFQTFNSKVAANIGFLLPEFPQLEEVWTKTNTPYLKMDAIFKGIKNLEETFHIYEELLETDGWTKDASNDHHSGFFKKNYTKLSYHASHDDPHLLEIKIDLVTTWENVQFEINKAYEISDLPEFPQFNVIRIRISAVNGQPSINIEIAGIADVAASFNTYKEVLATIGFTTDAVEGAKTGIFKKEGSPVSFRFILKAITNSLSLSFTTTGETPYNHNHWDAFQGAAQTKFGITLPDFVGSHEVKDFLTSETEIRGNVEIEAQATISESIESFMASLIADGWQAVGTPNSHMGTYVKGDYQLSYHEDHHDKTLVEVILVKLEAH